MFSSQKNSPFGSAAAILSKGPMALRPHLSVGLPLSVKSFPYYKSEVVMSTPCLQRNIITGFYIYQLNPVIILHCYAVFSNRACIISL
jgi:hypothetical protein